MQKPRESVRPQSVRLESVRLFESDFLEKVSRVHPITPLLFWTPVIAFFLYRSFSVFGMSAGEVFGIGVAALLVWTLVEYVLHRWVFHIEGKHPVAQRLHFIIHGNHHHVPQDPMRLVMPPLAGVIIATILFVPMFLVLGPVWVNPFFAFFLVGYLAYDYTHYAVHHFTPRTAWGRFVKQAHMMHHYANPNSRWGVSSPLWDFVFGTFNQATAASSKRVEPRGEQAPSTQARPAT
jgi:dihydroceramide fatty acyl 2-hydroxylase